jgi:hypothetical protein
MKSQVVCSRQSFSPHYHISEAEVTAIQQMMQQCFEQWGLPKCIRVDNGKPFGDPQCCSVPELDLWLIGLGVEVIWNRPRHPKDNAKVERMQATTSRWAEVEQCYNCTELQTRLNSAAQVQRERYQVRRLGAKSRKERYPELWSNSRTYSKDAFDVSRIGYYLSQTTFKRKVNKRGVFNFYAQRVYVGYSHLSKVVCLRYDAENKYFVLTDESNTAIGYIQADNFSRENILHFNICQDRYIKCQTMVAH